MATLSPEITVLMTVYNGSRYLKSSIESVLRQTFEDFEFLIINDHSSDDSLEKIQSFADKRITVYNNEENLGQTRSLNCGLNLAKGRYIARMDADDMAFPYWLKRQLDFLKRNPGYAVVSGNAAIIDDFNRIKKIFHFPSSMEDIVLKSLTSSPISHVGSIMRKDVVLKEGGYREDLKIAADYELWSTLIRKGYPLTNTREIVVAVRFHQDSVSKTQSEREAQEISQIIQRNIRESTTWQDVSLSETMLLEKLIYCPSVLSFDEFQKAQEIMGDVYRYLKPNLCPHSERIKKEFKRHLLKIYIKKIFSSSQSHNIHDIRRTSFDYLKRYGTFNIVSVFWVGSFLGTSLINAMAWWYETWMILMAKARLTYRFSLKNAGG